MSGILELLRITPSHQSIDYVQNKQPFHLFNLLTEQRHPETWDLSSAVQSDVEQGLCMIATVDSDIQRKIDKLAGAPGQLEEAVQAVVDAIRSGRRIYFYGCGATGRLAKQMESSLWRPFWRKLKQHPCWTKLQDHIPPDIEQRCIGEMTGADRALVSSLEGFEDLQLIGRLQLTDHGIQRGDVVFCVTEGGETSSVIGTILAALDQYGQPTEQVISEARRRLYFVYNNPDDLLRPFARSVSVIDNPAITKINLATGPQAVAGSTRMQATTIETFVLGVVLEEALARFLAEYLSASEMEAIGYVGSPSLSTRLASFANLKASVVAALPALAKLTALETDTYRRRRFSTYFANQALITVFIDNTERSPTFRLPPLDRTHDTRRQSWVQVWTEAADLNEAWHNFLGRPFRGLENAFYKTAFETQIEDPYLKAAALNSLQHAGNEEAEAYDFSFSQANVKRTGPGAGDLGVAVLLDRELRDLDDPRSSVSQFLELCRRRSANVAIVTCSEPSDQAATIPTHSGDMTVNVPMSSFSDPLTLRRQIALKMLLNAHSTATMAALGRVVGNTMTNVSPSNLKLIGRATFLIQSHVNDAVSRAAWAGEQTEKVTFTDANAVLFEAVEYVRSLDTKQTAEVALSIVRMIEALRRDAFVTWEEARAILDTRGLSNYLAAQNGLLEQTINAD